MFDLSGHHHLRDAFALEDINQLTELTDVDPVHGGSSEVSHVGSGFVLDGHDYDIMSFAASGLKRQQRKAAVAGDHSILHGRASLHCGPTLQIRGGKSARTQATV